MVAICDHPSVALCDQIAFPRCNANSQALS
jgi:hypothetical protein